MGYILHIFHVLVSTMISLLEPGFTTVHCVTIRIIEHVRRFDTLVAYST